LRKPRADLWRIAVQYVGYYGVHVELIEGAGRSQIHVRAKCRQLRRHISDDPHYLHARLRGEVIGVERRGTAAVYM